MPIWRIGIVSDVPIATIVNNMEIKRIKLFASAMVVRPVTMSIEANISVFLTPKISTSYPKKHPDIEIAKL